MRHVVVITGLSGSGKSMAARYLEDLGFFCVDNLPVTLIPPFYDLILKSGEHIHRAAVVVDVRERQFLEHLPAILEDLKNRRAPVSLLFFDSSDEVLKRRFSETRRPHPMASGGAGIEEAIRTERKVMAPLRNLADRIIDTTRFSVHDLRKFLKAAFSQQRGVDGLNVHVVSFGFKYGVPAESDLVFDVRFLPNPYFVDGLRDLDGTSEPVRTFLWEKPETEEFLSRIRDLLDFLVPLYAEEGKSYLTVTLGCTGGKHRSVALAEAVRDHLVSRLIPATVSHRDLGKE